MHADQQSEYSPEPLVHAHVAQVRRWALTVCEGCLQCESQVERLSGMALPSLGRFDAKSSQCVQWFRDGCVGPARERQEARLVHATGRERARFQRDYNNRLYMGLVILSLLAAVTGRFVVKRIALEAPGWLLFAFLQVRRQPPCLVGARSA